MVILRTCVISGPQKALVWLVVLFALVPLLVTASSPEMGRLNQAVIVKIGDRQVSLPAGMKLQIFNKGDVVTVVGFELEGTPVITQISSRQLDFLLAVPPRVGASPSPAPSALASGAPSSSLPTSVVPVSDTPSSPIAASDQGNGDSAEDALPDFRTTLSPADVELPTTRFTALHGYFYVVIDGTPIPVVYSLPMEGEHLAPSASNLIFYGPYPDEKTDLNRSIVPDIVTKLGCSIFSVSFKASDDDLSEPQTAYWSKESGWFKAVMDARAEIVKGFGLKKEKLLLMGYSGGGGMVLNLAGAFPDDVEAVAAQGANLAPDLIESNAIKWFMVNNRGDTNASVTQPFYERLKSMGCQALYSETTPSRVRGHYHSPSQQAFDLIYTFLAGVLEQRKRAELGRTGLTDQWPYAAPSDLLKRYRVVRSETLDPGSLRSFDLLPSAAFALNWSKVCPPVQTVTTADGEGRMHLNFPASSKPKGIVIYYDNPDYQEFPREFEDICALAESGCVVISPMFAMPPERFSRIASDWIVSQAKLQSLPVHLAAYGPYGAQFLSDMSDVTELSFKSVNLVSLTDFALQPAIKDNIEALAKGCGLYSFFVCRDMASSTSLTDLAGSLVDNQSRTRGCQEIIVDSDVDDETSIYQQALSTVLQTVNDYNGNVTAASPDLWLDQLSFSDQPLVINQEVDITVHIHDRGIYGKKSTIELKSLGAVLAKQDMSFNYDGDQEITLSYVPSEAGEVNAEVVLLPMPEEASRDNNQVNAKFVVGKGP